MDTIGQCVGQLVDVIQIEVADKEILKRFLADSIAHVVVPALVRPMQLLTMMISLS